MHASLLALVSTLAAGVTALPRSVQASRQTLASWPATNFVEGCSPGGCIASFNISAPAGYVEGAPAFDVTCHPIYIQQGWLDCDVVSGGDGDSVVQSMWTGASEFELIKISVAHLFSSSSSGTRYNASGSVEFPGGTTSFDVPVTNFSAVA
ncbi:hypothetical protein F4778DRAFT_426075 [Xylariomycetidae sp. FL2044]|nr:hypothetical protein F4778DRAFT_426075 [Xylariomycetidae sp. FL2044]